VLVPKSGLSDSGAARLVLAVAAGFAQPAWAQIAPPIPAIDNPNAVLARARPDYDVVGMRVGGFTLLPSLTAALAYDDNVLGSDQAQLSDAILTFSPRAQLVSNWSVHRLVVSAGAQIDRFAKHKSQNSEQYDVRADGTLDVRRQLSIEGGARTARLVEPRGSLGDAFIGGTPVTYQFNSGNLGARWQPGRLDVRVAGDVGAYSYNAIHLNGVRASQSYRDRRELNGAARVGYVLSPALQFYVSGTVSDIKYDNRSSGFDLDSHGYSVLGGIDLAISRLLVGNIGVGYLSRNFADNRFRDVGGLGFSGKLTWNPTPLLSLSATGSRTVAQAGIIGAAGAVERDLSGAVDYELLRNLLLHAELANQSESYRGIDRHDSLTSGAISARYLASRSLNLSLGYRRLDQTSSGVDARPYSDDRVELSVTVQR
jgi:hypothetical protein